ncbi:hypothetical protein ACIA49_04010 [Kribbella sp. NPDC051587]|uniref:hypothetical protein n=1 Tax=Kribbella sp. NPDC051587 TaxID=3364119 RepID=UPI003792424D
MMVDIEHETPINEVRIWFGQHLVVDHLDDPMSTTEFEQLMHEHFASLHMARRLAHTAVSSDAADS